MQATQQIVTPRIVTITRSVETVPHTPINMLGVYGTVAALGYWYFGKSAHTLITTDLARNSPFTGHYLLLPGLTADKLVALCILLNAYSTYPSLVLVMQVRHATPFTCFSALCCTNAAYLVVTMSME